MTDIHPFPPNLVPGALPQTPASEWAENMKDVLGGHVTRTPVGTPGPAIPGGFPAHLKPDTPDDAPQGTLLASAQSYMPSLATAKAYLPQAVAAYLRASLSFHAVCDL
ncbi:hypothetical protein B0H13DRAFT_1610070 [Mycena leptocephala]|nr:hypothetical protein B0H13DRAFT_1610070 [Mycena leptocephala]